MEKLEKEILSLEEKLNLKLEDWSPLAFSDAVSKLNQEDLEISDELFVHLGETDRLKHNDRRFYKMSWYLRQIFQVAEVTEDIIGVIEDHDDVDDSILKNQILDHIKTVKSTDNTFLELMTINVIQLVNTGYEFGINVEDHFNIREVIEKSFEMVELSLSDRNYETDFYIEHAFNVASETLNLISIIDTEHRNSTDQELLTEEEAVRYNYYTQEFSKMFDYVKSIVESEEDINEEE